MRPAEARIGQATEEDCGVGTRVRVVQPIDTRRLFLPWFCFAFFGGMILSAASSVAIQLAYLMMAGSVRSGGSGEWFFISILIALTMVVGVGAACVVRPLFVRVWFGPAGMIVALLVVAGITLGAGAGVFVLDSSSLVYFFPFVSWPDVFGWMSLLPTPVFWSLSSAGAILLGLMTVSLAEGRRIPQRGRLCTTCAYDLRDMPPAVVRCPECGSEIQETRRWSWVMRWFVTEPPGWRPVGAVTLVLMFVVCAWGSVVRLRPLLELQYGVGHGLEGESMYDEAAIWIPDSVQADRFFRVDFAPAHRFNFSYGLPQMMNVVVSGQRVSGLIRYADSGNVHISATVNGSAAQRQLRREGPPNELLDELRRRADEAGWHPTPKPLPGAWPTYPAPSRSIGFDGTPYFSQSGMPHPGVSP